MELHEITFGWAESPDGIHEGWPYATCACGETLTAKDLDLVEEIVGVHLNQLVVSAYNAEEAREYIEDAIDRYGKSPGDYDIDGIYLETFMYSGIFGRPLMMLPEKEFWEVVETFEYTDSND